MNATTTCSKCGTPLPEGLSVARCPACLLKAIMVDTLMPAGLLANPDSLAEPSASTDATREALGTLIGRYKLLQQIGEGDG